MPKDRTEPVFYVRMRPLGAPKNDWRRIDLTGKVLSFEFEDVEKKADKLSLTVDNWDLSHFDDPVWRSGNTLEISWGYPGKMSMARQLVIQKITGFQQLKIEALGKEVLHGKVTQNRTFEQMTRSQVAEALAKEMGFRNNDELHIQDTEVVHEAITQTRMTNLQFLRKLATRENYEFYIDFDGFHFHEADLLQRPTRVFYWFNAPDHDHMEIISIDVDHDITAKPARVKVKGRNPVQRVDVEGDAGPSPTNPQGLAGAFQNFLSGVPGGEQANALLNSLQPSSGSRSRTDPAEPVAELRLDKETGKRVGWFAEAPSGANESAQEQMSEDSRQSEANAGRDDPAFTGTVTMLIDKNTSKRLGWVAEAQEATATTAEETPEAAQRDARAKYRRIKRKEVKIKLKIIGDPRILAKTTFELRNAGKMLSGRYYATKVKHTLGGSFVCMIEAKSDGSGGKKSGSKHASGVQNQQQVKNKGKRGPSAAPACDPSVTSCGPDPNAAAEEARYPWNEPQPQYPWNTGFDEDADQAYVQFSSQPDVRPKPNLTGDQEIWQWQYQQFSGGSTAPPMSSTGGEGGAGSMSGGGGS